LTQDPQSVVADKLLDRELHQPKDFGFGLQLTHDFESLLQNKNYWPFKADVALYQVVCLLVEGSRQHHTIERGWGLAQAEHT